MPVSARIREQAAVAVRRGHPWIYRDQVVGTVKAASGDGVTVMDDANSIVCLGMWNGSSPIAIRVWTDGKPLDDVLGERIDRALARRTFDEKTTAFRCLNGEGDRTPGFVVDRYAHVAVMRTDGDGAGVRRSWMARAIFPKLGVRTLVHRDHETGALEHLEGDPAPSSIDVFEHGVPMRVDLAHGQKTGAFLDQRENRRRVGALAHGRRVLNLFSYAGGFSVHAALGGASHTTSVDIAMHAHKTAQDSFKLAGIDPSKHAFVTADAFQFLERAKERGETWDLVVSDPPSFAPSEEKKARAISAYKKLHRACAGVLAKNGIFCASSCSSHVTDRDFLTTLTDDAIGRADLSVTEIHGQPSDHPVLAGWPEGRYLKFVILR